MIFKKREPRAALRDLSTPTMLSQRKKVAALKTAIAENKAELVKQAEETKQLIAEVSAKLKARLKRADSNMGLFTSNRHEGIIFVDFKGEIIHVNHAAASLLNQPVDKLLHKRIDYILTGHKKRKLSMQDCSKLIIEKVKEDEDSTYDEICETARTAYLLKTSNMAMHLDEPVCIVLKSGDTIHPLCIIISLLDTSPKELEDVTFLCKISRIAGSVPPRYSEKAADADEVSEQLDRD